MQPPLPTRRHAGPGHAAAGMMTTTMAVERPATESTRARRLAQELEHYRQVENVHDLPAIYHRWSNRHVAPKLHELGFEAYDDFFRRPVLAACHASPDRV